DVVVGGATAALLLDVLRVFFGVEGLETATSWVLGLVVLSALGAILTGLTDYKDTAPSSAERDMTGLHGLINIAGTIIFAISLLQRLGGGHDGAFWVLLVGYLVVSVGAYIGGHVVYKYGYMVNHNAFSRSKRAKDFTPIMAASELPEETPTKVSFGSTALMLVRRGDVVHALKETCSHAGGPLSEGALGEGTITCPWHFSTFRLADGSVVHGPAGTRQVSYRARVNGDQVEIQGPYE
ncbi:MAG TPA: Rieske 2Fe-2S domain-containing protein, partial [Candidatus Limnocylindria bacterium]